MEALLERLGLRDLATVHYKPNSYIWRLMKILEEDPVPVFDLCYLDGADNWCYTESAATKDTETLKAMPSEEIEYYQLREVYELLV